MSRPSGANDPIKDRAAETSGVSAALRHMVSSREFGVVAAFIALCIAMLLTDSGHTFFSQRNIQNVLRNTSMLAVFAIGETVVIIAGGIDLCIGSLIAFTGMLMAMFITRLAVPLNDGPAVFFGILLALLVALLIGIWHATLIHRLRLPAFVVTLASLLLLRSQAMVVNRQMPITLEKYPAVSELANGSLFPNSAFPIPMPLVMMAVVAIVVSLLLSRCRPGRYVYSIGSNEVATDLSGVNVYRVKMFAYGASALLGGLGGVLFASYGGQGDPLAGQAYELDAVAAAVVGGASLAGGQGSVIGTILGSLLLQSMFSAINLTVQRPDLWRGSVVGGVLVFAVLVTALQQRRTQTR